MMKKIFPLALCSLLLLGSCGTYTGSGAYVGSSLGSILGSAIGGLSGGPRGADIGTIVGMAGGAVVGAAIGSQADQQQQAQNRQQQCQRHQYDESDVYCQPNQQVFDSSNSGDDRLYDFDGSNTYVDNYNATANLDIIKSRFIDSNGDNVLGRNETCKLVFEVMNRGSLPVYDVVPTVVETTGNRHIFVSPSIRIERIDPGKGVRYTAMIKSDSRLKTGNARFCVSVVQNGKSISKVNEFNIPTSNE